MASNPIQQKAYASTDKGREARARAQRNYSMSEKGRAKISARAARDEVKKVRAAEKRARLATPEGRAVMEAYNASPKGKASNVERAHRRRARRRDVEVERLTPLAVMMVYKDFGGICGYCRDQPAEELDHFVPISRGGAHALKNLVASCALCNQRKHCKDPFSFLHDLKVEQRRADTLT